LQALDIFSLLAIFNITNVIINNHSNC